MTFESQLGMTLPGFISPHLKSLNNGAALLFGNFPACPHRSFMVSGLGKNIIPRASLGLLLHLFPQGLDLAAMSFFFEAFMFGCGWGLRGFAFLRGNQRLPDEGS